MRASYRELCLKSSILTGLDEVARLIAAERRDVYSDVTNSPSLRKERNAQHFALCGRRDRPAVFYKHYVPTARFRPESLRNHF
jgi:hypothetical protein